MIVELTQFIRFLFRKPSQRRCIHDFQDVGEPFLTNPLRSENQRYDMYCPICDLRKYYVTKRNRLRILNIQFARNSYNIRLSKIESSKEA